MVCIFGVSAVLITAFLRLFERFCDTEPKVGWYLTSPGATPPTLTFDFDLRTGAYDEHLGRFKRKLRCTEAIDISLIRRLTRHRPAFRRAVIRPKRRTDTCGHRGRSQLRFQVLVQSEGISYMFTSPLECMSGSALGRRRQCSVASPLPFGTCGIRKTRSANLFTQSGTRLCRE